uniref:Uncharacterized protein n=1 Tax=Anguilla anguilla TaxID=7936 RepID=A0A0E9R0T1_ANGAN
MVAGPVTATAQTCTFVELRHDPCINSSEGAQIDNIMLARFLFLLVILFHLHFREEFWLDCLLALSLLG